MKKSTSILGGEFIEDGTSMVIVNKKKKPDKIIVVDTGVKDVMNVFYKANPTLNWANKTFRSSASWMINKFGLEETIKMAEAAVAVHGVAYAPQIFNPWELKEKLMKLNYYIQNNAKDNQPKKLQEL